MTIKAQYVYLFKSGKHFKVGKTENIQSRVKGLQTSSPFEIEIIDYFQTLNSSMDEKIIHQILKPFNIRGEWFDIPSEFMNQKHIWFKSYAIEDDCKLQNDKNKEICINTYSYQNFKEDCLSENGYLFLIESLSNSQLFAYKFIRENTELTLKNAVENQDDYMLYFCYKLLVDRKFDIQINNFSDNFIYLIQENRNKQTSYLSALITSVQQIQILKVTTN